MNPGEMLALKKRVIERLSQQEWDDIDLTLNEFGLPWDEQWSGEGSKRYVTEMLTHCHDEEKLRQLDLYLSPESTGGVASTRDSFDENASPWTGNGFRLFISHTVKYAQQAGDLRSEFEKRSVDAFVAHDDIQPTEEWREVIQSALATCDACMALLVPGFRESEWTDQEVGWCMGRDVLVVPVNHGLVPYGFLGRYQAYTMRMGQGVGDVALGVFEILVRKPQTRAAMARALVERWTVTGSWNQARQNYAFLRTIPKETWTKELADMVWVARDRNHELKTASLDWSDSEVALNNLFAGTPYQRPEPPPEWLPEGEIEF